MFPEFPVYLLFLEIPLEFNPGGKIMEIGRIVVFTFLLKVAMVAANVGTIRVNRAAVIRALVFAGAPEFDMPFFVVIHENINVHVGKVPSDVVVLPFCRGPVYFNGCILAALSAAVGAGWLKGILYFLHNVFSQSPWIFTKHSMNTSW
jgi:hypothetical protein